MILKVLMSLLCLQFKSVISCNVRPEIRCEDGWTYYKRKTTGWCMKVVVTKEIMTQTDGAAACAELGAVLTSIDNSEMKDVINSLRAAKNVLISGKTWIGGELKSECTSSNCGEKNDMDHCKLTETCGNNRYEWTDGFTTSSSNQFLIDEMTNTSWLGVMEGYYIPDPIMSMSNTGFGNLASQPPKSAICGKESIEDSSYESESIEIFGF